MVNETLTRWNKPTGRRVREEPASFCPHGPALESAPLPLGAFSLARASLIEAGRIGWRREPMGRPELYLGRDVSQPPSLGAHARMPAALLRPAKRPARIRPSPEHRLPGPCPPG